MNAITEYETLRGYRLPAGWTPERVEHERKHNAIAEHFVPLARAPGVVAWGVPYLLQFHNPGIYASLDGRFETLSIAGGLIEVNDLDAPHSRQWNIVESINAAEQWCRERAAFCWI